MCPTVAPNHLDAAEISVQKDLAYFDDSHFDGSNSHDIKQLGIPRSTGALFWRFIGGPLFLGIVIA